MKSQQFEFISNLDTLAAVVLGAAVATIGGLLAEHYEDIIERRRRERDAARFFADILSSIDAILDMAFRSQTIGDPWGPVTVRMFKTALREAEVYERNRERLFDIADPGLRAAVHRHFLFEAFPLEALVDSTDMIVSLEDRAAMAAAPASDALADRIAAQRALRERALETLKEERGRSKALCESLLARARMPGAKPIASAPA
jgi:hypothetical protein